MSCLVPYAPLGCTKAVAPDVWIVDGPEVGMRYHGLILPFTTRCTIVRLSNGALLVHSPTALSDALARELQALGDVRYLVAPNRLHTTWLAEWKRRWPAARTAGIAGEPAWDGTPVAYDLDLADGLPATPELECRVVRGGVFSEAVFVHSPSRTLILTDLVENFELSRVTCRWLRLLLRLTGPLDPNGTAPPDMRFSFRKHRPALRAAVAWMQSSAPERVIFSHGRWYERDGARELERAFAWVG